jgi:Tol biopolymer transport system component
LGRLDVLVLNLSDGTFTPVTHDGHGLAPFFSKDGAYLYYAVQGTSVAQIFRERWPGGVAEQVTQGGGLYAIESAQGDLYFTRADRNGLWVRSASPGGEETLVLADLAAEDFAHFAVTRDALYFVSRPDGETPHLMRYDLATRQSTRLRVLPNLYTRSGLSVSADEKAVFVAEVAHTQVDLKLASVQ